MYNISSLIKLAINIEEAGFNFYTDLKKNNDKDYLNLLLNKFINDELNHKKTFEELNNSIKYNTTPIEIGELLKKQIDFFNNKLIFNTDKLNYLINNKLDAIKLINFAISIEEASIIYFNEIKILVEYKYRTFIDNIIEQEKYHLKELISLRTNYNKIKEHKKNEKI